MQTCSDPAWTKLCLGRVQFNCNECSGVESEIQNGTSSAGPCYSVSLERMVPNWPAVVAQYTSASGRENELVGEYHGDWREKRVMRV